MILKLYLQATFCFNSLIKIVSKFLKVQIIFLLLFVIIMEFKCYNHHSNFVSMKKGCHGLSLCLSLFCGKVARGGVDGMWPYKTNAQKGEKSRKLLIWMLNKFDVEMNKSSFSRSFFKSESLKEFDFLPFHK